MVVVQIQFKQLTAQNLSKLGELVSTEIDSGQELQLLVGLAHEVIVHDFVIFGLKDLKEGKSPQLIDVGESVSVEVYFSEVLVVLKLISQVIDSVAIQIQHAESVSCTI